MTWEEIIKEIRRKPQTRISGGDISVDEAMSDDDRTLVADTRKQTLEAIYKILRDMGEGELVSILEERLVGME